MIHQCKNFSAFNYFASTLVGHSKKLQGIRAFGSDGDKALVDAFAHNFPSTKQLRCFIHLKRNIAEKLKERGFPSAVSDEFLADIFGKHTGSIYEEGLVDANNEEDFDIRLSKCSKVWQVREGPYLHSGHSFFEYFSKYYANTVRLNMLKDLRITVGLGNPPAIFTTNSSESINAMIKRKVNFKETEWPKFNQELKQIVNVMHEEGIRALSGRGCYRLCKPYKHLQVDPSRWAQMTADQRRALVKQFDSAPLQVPNFGEQGGRAPQPVVTSISGEAQLEKQSLAGGAQAVAATNAATKLSVTAENSGIQTLTFETVRCIWAKAEEYLRSGNDVVPAPGSSKSMMVASRSSKTPHFVCAGPNGQYSCDNNCPQWKSSQICAHVIAAAQRNCKLQNFLEWYNSSGQGPNITTLAMSQLPSGRGRKGGVPKRKRSAGVRKDPELTVQRPAFREHRLPGSQTSANMQEATSSRDPPNTHHPIFQASQKGAGGSSLVTRPGGTNDVSTDFLPQTHCGTEHVTGPNIRAIGSIVTVSSPSPANVGVAGVTHPAVYNSNPFFVRFIHGNIRVCQGCRSSLCSVDGNIPKAPFDLAVARFEKRPYRGKTGELVTPVREQAAHYHLKVGCIRCASPQFVPTGLTIPLDVSPLLTATHKEYLRLMFGLQVNAL